MRPTTAVILAAGLAAVDGMQQGAATPLQPYEGVSSATASPTLRPDFSRVQLTYLGRERVLAFDQWTGEHALWQLERGELSKCDAFMWPPLSAGKWPALRYREFVFAGLTQLISLDPRAGTLTLTECDDAAFLPRCHGQALRCAPLFEHALTNFQRPGAVHELTYLGKVRAREWLPSRPLRLPMPPARQPSHRPHGCHLPHAGAAPPLRAHIGTLRAARLRALRAQHDGAAPLRPLRAADHRHAAGGCASHLPRGRLPAGLPAALVGQL